MVAPFVALEDALAELGKARAVAVETDADNVPAISPELLARLEVFRDPAIAWGRFTRRTRKEVLRALARGVTIYPDICGYFLVIDWDGGGRAAAKVKTRARRKLFSVPEDVLALFDAEMSGDAVTRRVAARPDTSYEDTVKRLAALDLDLVEVPDVH